MTEEGVCIHCGTKAGSLYRRYSASVLKLTQCARCGNDADKYIEYDPVIIIVDLVLLSKPAIRHILYNTKFEAYWRIFIFLLILDTYLSWADENQNRPALNSHSQNVEHLVFEDNVYYQISNSNFSLIGSLNSIQPTSRSTEISIKDEPLLLQINIYVKFLSCLFEMLMFYLSTFLFSIMFGLTSLLKEKIDFTLVCKFLTLAVSGNFLLLPTLIWGSEYDRSINHIIMFGYTSAAYVIVHSVVFSCSKMNSLMVLLVSYVVKFSLHNELKVISSRMTDFLTELIF